MHTAFLLLANLLLVPPATQSTEGCYDVAVGLWRAVTDAPVDRPALPPSTGRDSTSYLVPPRLLLARTPGPELPGGPWFQAGAPEGALPTGQRHQGWRIDGERLDLVFSTGRIGVTAELRRDGSTWTGLLTTGGGHRGTQRYERSVTLHPVDCASPPPVPATVLRHLPRSVELEAGGVLELKGSPPQGLRTADRPSGAVGVEGRSSGLFAGSDSIAYRVGENDGRIGVIQLLYPRSASADELIARITRAYGSPDPATGVPGAWWHNRVTEVSVITDETGRGFRVLIQDPRSW